jgi:hypothetical protein
MRISLITAAAVMLAGSTAVGQQQPTIQVSIPNIPGVTTPRQQHPNYPPGQEPYGVTNLIVVTRGIGVVTLPTVAKAVGIARISLIKNGICATG